MQDGLRATPCPGPRMTPGKLEWQSIIFGGFLRWIRDVISADLQVAGYPKSRNGNVSEMTQGHVDTKLLLVIYLTVIIRSSLLVLFDIMLLLLGLVVSFSTSFRGSSFFDIMNTSF